MSYFNFQWTKTLFQNNLRHNAFFFFFYTFQGLWTLVICNNTNENFLWEPEKIKNIHFPDGICLKFIILNYNA